MNPCDRQDVEIMVEWERCGCVRSFDKWEEARGHIAERLQERGFEPFYVAKVQYSGPRDWQVIWDFEWTDTSMIARKQDREYFRQIGVWEKVRGLFRLEWCGGVRV